MSRRSTGLQLATEVSLAVVTLAAIVGMHRLFIDGSFRGPLFVQAIAAHVTVALLRRGGVRLLPAALTTLGVAILLVTWTRFPDTARWLLPTPETASTLGRDLGDSWSLFGDVRAPAPVHNGFLAATSMAVWVIVFVADWAAFRVSATFEALLPAATLFVFAAALGGDGSPVASAATFAAAALVHLLLHRTALQERSSRWASERRARGRRSLVATGASITGLAVLVGVVAGPNLPGADADAVVAWRDLNKGEPPRVVLSPLVSMQTSLVEQADVEVFTVRSERPSYWRLTALDEFDGEIWKSSYQTGDADGELPRRFEPAGDRETIEQRITIEALNAVWLPAAFEPVAHDPGEDQPAVYDERSSTLMVDRDVEASDGYSYTVTSEVPVLDAERLRRASTEVPDEIAETYTELPGDFPEMASTLAFQITNGQPTPYDKALALQDYLRTFTYDQDIGPGHGEDALLTFLFETKRGYCEQFAAAFAALARSADLPARVAVGFTKGVQDPNDPGLYRVRGTHAHAWAEVYLGEYGWVTFEPTPGRGPTGGESYLGIPEAQATTAGEAPVPTDEPLAGAGDGLGSEGGAGEAGQTGRLPDANIEGAAGDPGGERDEGSWLPAEVVRAFGLALLAAVAYAVVVPAALAVQQVVRRRRATTPAARTRLWWRAVTDSAAIGGIALPPWLTIAETADRLAAALPSAAPAIGDLAQTLETLEYAEVAPDAEVVARAEPSWSAAVREANRQQTWGQRAGKLLDARRLFGHRPGRLVAHQGPALDPSI